MAVSSLKNRSSFFWIPAGTPEYKITVEKDGTEEDITEFVHYCRVFDGVTETVGEFEFKINDPQEIYKDKWVGNEIFRFYMDYAATATTLRFRGRIEKPSNQSNNTLRIYGRSESKRFLNISVTKSYENSEASTILKDLIDTYGGGNFTYNNVETSNTDITVSWFEKPFWECVQELCSSAGFDCYVDSDRDFNFFEVGSRSNTGEAIVHNQNLVDIGDFAPDLTQVRNVVRVYGTAKENTQLIYTDKDQDSIDSYGESVEIIRDDNITSQSQIERIASTRLSELKDPPTVGEITGITLATIQPGEQIYLSSPETNIPPQLYDILDYEHEIDLQGKGITTKVTVNKEPRNASLVFKGIIQRLNQTQDNSINPFQMEYTYNDTFEKDTGSHSNTEISDGVLMLNDGAVSGTWISETQTAPVNLSQAFLVLNGINLASSTVSISTDGGVSYTEIGKDERIILTGGGKQLKVKIQIDSDSTEIESYSIQYK